MSKRKFIWKSAVTGEIVSEEYALENPDTTYKHALSKDEEE